jgi:WD40 repeat protein
MAVHETLDDKRTSVSTRGALRTRWQVVLDEFPMSTAVLPSTGDIVTVLSTGCVERYEQSSGKRQWRFTPSRPGGGMSVAISPVSDDLAVAHQNGTCTILTAADGSPQKIIEVGRGFVDATAWSRSGRLLAIACGRNVVVVDRSGELVFTSPEHPGTVTGLAFSQSEELLTACHGCVASYRLPSGEALETFLFAGSPVSLVISPVGEHVVVGCLDRTIHFWRRSTGRDSMMSGYDTKPTALAFDDRSHHLATGGGRDIMVWSFGKKGPEGTEPSLLCAHVDNVRALAFARRSRLLASGGADGGVILWGLDSRGRGTQLGAARASSAVHGVVFTPDNKTIVASSAAGILLAFDVDAAGSHTGSS